MKINSWLCLFLATLVLASLGGCDAVGGGETVVQGNDNVVVTDDVVDRVAAALARFESTPEVTDAELATLYGRIREEAMAGNLEAAMVVLKVAAIQRRPEDPEDPDEVESE